LAGSGSNPTVSPAGPGEAGPAGGRRLALELLPYRLAVCRLGPEEPLPPWAHGGTFSSATRTPEELSLVCEETLVPEGTRAERGWRALQMKGQFAFTETGILASLVGPLSLAGIACFAISTFDTDYILIADPVVELAIRVLRRAGHEVSRTPAE
jgi:hypothetical protein